MINSLFSGEGVREDVKSFLNYVISGFEGKQLLVPCARAFKAICIDHKQILAPLAYEITDKGKLFQ